MAVLSQVGPRMLGTRVSLQLLTILKRPPWESPACCVSYDTTLQDSKVLCEDSVESIFTLNFAPRIPLEK